MKKETKKYLKIGDKEIQLQSETEIVLDTGRIPVVESNESMNIKEAFDFLGISEHLDRAWNSSSTGELFFLSDYISIATHFKNNGVTDVSDFTKWFNEIVDYAYANWKRPISIYQHVLNPENFVD